MCGVVHSYHQHTAGTCCWGGVRVGLRMVVLVAQVMSVSPRYDQYKTAWDTSVATTVLGEDIRFFHEVRAGVDRVFVDSPLFLAKVWGKTGSKLYGLKSGADFNDNQKRFAVFCKVRIWIAKWHVADSRATHCKNRTLTPAHMWIRSVRQQTTSAPTTARTLQLSCFRSTSLGVYSLASGGVRGVQDAAVRLRRGRGVRGQRLALGHGAGDAQDGVPAQRRVQERQGGVRRAQHRVPGKRRTASPGTNLPTCQNRMPCASRTDCGWLVLPRAASGRRRTC